MPAPEILHQRYTANDDAAVAWFPCSLDKIEQHAAKRQNMQPLRGEELDEWKEFLRPFSPPQAAIDNIDRLTDSRARVVVTGQQTGLLGGPLYTVYKAIGAFRWARRLERQLEIPVIPVFWAASDDHDFDEVASVKWLDQKGGLQSWTINPNPGEESLPVYSRAIDPGEFRALAARFAETTAPGDFRDSIVSFVEGLAELQPLNWETQFIACLVRWFGNEGLVPIVPRLGFMRRRAVRIMEQEIASAPSASAQLLQTLDDISAEFGKGSGLHRSGNEANFFLMQDQRRCKVTVDGGEFHITPPAGDSKIIARESMLEMLREKPGLFSPNAALRPLVQDDALPTAAYIGGPSELLYHAQIAPLYKLFGVVRPALVPRPSVLLVEPRVKRTLDKLDISAETIASANSGTIDEAAARAVDETGLRHRVENHVGLALGEINSLMKLIEDETADTGLSKAAEKIHQSVETTSQKVMERLDQYLSRRNADIAGQCERAKNSLWPNGEPQERVLGSLAPLWRIGGPDIHARIIETIKEDCWTTQVIDLGPTGI